VEVVIGSSSLGVDSGRAGGPCYTRNPSANPGPATLVRVSDDALLPRGCGTSWSPDGRSAGTG